MAQCEVIIGVNVTGLGSELNKRIRFTTTNTPEAISSGYGTIAAADTFEAVPLGQVAASTIDMFYIRAIDNDIYLEAKGTTLSVADFLIPSGEANLFRPVVSTGAAVCLLVMADTAESNYEYLIVGQSS